MTELKEQIERDLAAAEPALEKASAALDSLNKKDLGELKSLGKVFAFRPPTHFSHMSHPTFSHISHFNLAFEPPTGVDDITAACIYMLHEGGSKGGGSAKIDVSWKAAQILMKDVSRFLESLVALKDRIDSNLVPKSNFRALKPLLDKECPPSPPPSPPPPHFPAFCPLPPHLPPAK